MSGRESRLQTIRELFRRAATSGTDLEIVADTQAAAQHAADKGWIRHEALASVAAEVERDKAESDSETDIVDEHRDR